MSEGPAVISYYVDDYLEDENSCYFCCNSYHSDGNHAVLLVGWADNFDHNKFNYATNNGAWIIKNSWGNEYDYISYDDKSLLGTNINAYTVQVSKNEASDTDMVYDNIFTFFITIFNKRIPDSDIR